MSNEYTFTMTDRQKKRYAVEQYNLRYVEQQKEKEARERLSIGSPHDRALPSVSNEPIEIKCDLSKSDKIALIGPEQAGEMGKQQAREEICQLLIEENDSQKFNAYLAKLGNVRFQDVPLRKLKIQSLKDVDPKEIMTYVEMYRQVIHDVYGEKKDGQ